MRAAIYGGPGQITVGERPDPVIKDPTDAIGRVTLACVCGSDLWSFALGPTATLLFWINALVFGSVAVYALALCIQLSVAVVSFYSLVFASQA